MKSKSIILAVYAILVLAGGAIGYVTAGSLMSIVMAGGFAFALLACSYLTAKGNLKAYDIALGLLGVLLVFFGYRFFASFKIMPSGLMTVLTAATLVYLGTMRNRLFHSGLL